MFAFELYKALRKKEIWILIIAGIILEIMLASQNNVVLPEGVRLKIYKYYINRVKGEYTDEKYKSLVNERNRYQEYIDDKELYDEKYNNDEIDATTYREILNNVKEAEERLGTLEYIVEKSMYLEQLSHETDMVRYFYDININDYVENMGIDIVVIILITVISVHIFGEDYSCGTQSMVITSEYGRKRLYRARLRCVIFISSVIGAVFPIIEFITKNEKYNLGDFHAGIRCLSSMSESELNLSIKNYLVICVFTRMLASVFYCIIVMEMTFLIKNTISEYVVSIGIVYLPYIVFENAGKYINIISLCKGFDTYKGYSHAQKLIGLHGMIVWLILYVTACVGISLKVNFQTTH